MRRTQSKRQNITTCWEQKVPLHEQKTTSSFQNTAHNISMRMKKTFMSTITFFCEAETQGIMTLMTVCWRNRKLQEFLGKCFGNWQKGGRGFVWWVKHFQLPFISFKDVTEWQLLLLESAETAVGEMNGKLDREGTSEGGSENQHNQDLERIPRHANLAKRWWSRRSVLIWYISRLWTLSIVERCQQMAINLNCLVLLLYFIVQLFRSVAYGQNVISRDA